MPSPEWTLSSLLRWATGFFQQKGIDSPRITAEVLLAHSLHLTRLDLYLRHDQPLNAGELAAFKALLRRRLSREPVAYITGTKEFWSLELRVGPSVLIPRPETECLVEAALEAADRMGTGRPLRILDLGTGSGAIAIALAAERPGSWILATDISPAALAVARKNAVEHGVEGRVHFAAGDWLAPIRSARWPFDIIVSNPPYIPSGAIDSLAPEVGRHEPRLALDGREDGLGCLREILEAAPGCLRSGGRLLLEIGHDQRGALEQLLRGAGSFGEVAFKKDYSGLDRILLATRSEIPAAGPATKERS